MVPIGQGLDFGCRERPLVDPHIVDQTVEKAAVRIIRKSNVHPGLPVEIRAGLGAAGGQFTIQIEVLPTHASAKGVNQVVPFAVRVIRTGGLDDLIVPYSGIHVAAAQIDVTIPAAGTEDTIGDGKEAAIDAGGLEPKGDRSLALGDVDGGRRVAIYSIESQGVRVVKSNSGWRDGGKSGVVDRRPMMPVTR